jgi:hypothetical protein
MQQPVTASTDQRVAPGPVTAVQGEQYSPVIAVVLLPRTLVGDRLVGILIGQVVEFVVGNSDGQSVVGGDVGQLAGNRLGTVKELWDWGGLLLSWLADGHAGWCC